MNRGKCSRGQEARVDVPAVMTVNTVPLRGNGTGGLDLTSSLNANIGSVQCYAKDVR